MAILGMQAGKHVYVEKPCSHNPAEGALLVAAQKTLPSPSAVQLGLELTVPERVFQVPQEEPLNSLTMSVDFAVSTAQATWSLDTEAQDG